MAHDLGVALLEKPGRLAGALAEYRAALRKPTGALPNIR